MTSDQCHEWNSVIGAPCVLKDGHAGNCRFERQTAMRRRTMIDNPERGAEPRPQSPKPICP